MLRYFKNKCYVYATMHRCTPSVIRGNLRKIILKTLVKPNTPTTLAKILDTDRPSVSRSILFLCDENLLKCLNPKDKRGRLYQVTSEGKKVLKDMIEMRL